MTTKSTSSLIIDKFGLNLYQKTLKFPRNKINVFYLREDPLKIRSIILDNDREYHLIINEKKNEIFHDCPLFLIHSEKDKKICVHFIKLLSIINKQHSEKILKNMEGYNLTSDDFGSKKKGKNYQLLANNCIENNNCVEALNYLKKAIISQFENESAIKDYLTIATENNLFIEFFEFLKHGYENGSKDIFKFDEIVNIGFKKFLNVIHEYSFFNILRIIESIDSILNFRNVSFIAPYFDKLKKLVNSSYFNENYFSIYLIKKNNRELIKYNPNFKGIFTQDQLNSLKSKLLNYFLSEIDSFCLIDKLKLLKRQFQIIEIPKDKFLSEYKKYKTEIKHLEKKLYLKKFAFLKLLIEKYNIKKTNGEFRKKRNAYIVNHLDDNLEKPVYSYIISRIGFFGLNEQTIKSSEIGINYFIMKELFLDDISTFQDVNYYKTQFWGDSDNLINPIDGFSLLTKNIEFSYEDEQKYSEDVIIIEWDLANKPIQGSIVNAYGSQIIIPDQNNPLFHDLKPFDLCYCKKTPVKIESNIIKIVNIITKCSFKDAIISVAKGMTFIEGYYPLSLVRAVINKEMSPFHANEIITNNENKSFIPNYTQFVQAFREFLFNFIFKEKEYIFEEIKSDFESKSDQILILLGLTNELNGLTLPYSEISKDILHPDMNLNEFRTEFLNRTHLFIKEILNKRDLGSTKIFDLKKLRNTQFFKYADKILKIRKEEFESTRIVRFNDGNGPRYNISEIKKTYYGQKFSNILHFEALLSIKPEKFKKFQDFALKLNLNLMIIDEIIKV
ncbi:MAG: hypothetical protein ACFE94_00400 [Candidatus Hodarchaeota archaeon]